MSRMKIALSITIKPFKDTAMSELDILAREIEGYLKKYAADDRNNFV